MRNQEKKIKDLEKSEREKEKWMSRAAECFRNPHILIKLSDNQKQIFISNLEKCKDYLE